MTDEQWKARMRQLNDRLRCHDIGGRVMITQGIMDLGPQRIADIRRAVATFDAFTPDNDPHEEHDCAILAVDDVEVLWKIDYYDLDLASYSPDPANPAVTVRVLTIMRAEEY